MARPAPAGRVLVVDDDAEICHVLNDLLNNRSYEVAIAASGIEALQQLATFKPDVVLLDIWMHGGMSGADSSRNYA